MFHVGAYFNSALATTANTDIAAVNDQVLVVQNNHFLLPRDMQLIAAYGGSATLKRMRLVAPSLYAPINPKLWPINKVLLPPQNPNIVDYIDTPLRLHGREEVAIQATANPGTTEPFYAALFLTDGLQPAPVGDYMSIRGTGTTTLVQGVWTDVPITWEDTLPSGRYAVVGGSANSTTGILYRLIFDDTNMRPGGVMGATPDLRPYLPWEKGGLGQWGTFVTTAFPRVQMMSNAGDTVEEIFLDVVRLSTSLAA